MDGSRTGYPSIAETGAKPGDRVRCLGDRDEIGRFRVGRVYEVVDFAGAPCAHGHIEGEIISPCACRGYGFMWELAGDESLKAVA